MAMDIIKRGTRDLVRSVLREKQIKSCSSETRIRTICYADQPVISVKYKGPLEFLYKDGRIIINRHFDKDNSGYRKIDNDLFHLIDDSHKSITAINYVGAKQACHHECVGTLEVSDPNFSELVGEIVDKYIVDRHKKASQHKRIVTASDEDWFIPDIELTDNKIEAVAIHIPQPSKSLISIVWNYVFGRFKLPPPPSPPVDNDHDVFYLKQAILRHCNISSNELLAIESTAATLKFSKLQHERIEMATKLIKEQNS